MDVNELRALAARESRTLTIPLEVRAGSDGDGHVVTGHAAVFDRWSGDLGGFQERIARGAFRKALAAGQDVVLTLEHNNEYVLASTRDGSLTLKEDGRGLAMRAEIDETYFYAPTVLKRMEKGELTQMSFAFRVAPEGDEWDDKGGVIRRTVYEVASLHDVTLTVNPAYSQTDAGVARSRPDGQINVTVNIDGDQLTEALERTLTKIGAPLSMEGASPEAMGDAADTETGDLGGPIVVEGDDTPTDAGGQVMRHLPTARRRIQLRRAKLGRAAAQTTPLKEADE